MSKYTGTKGSTKNVSPEEVSPKKNNMGERIQKLLSSAGVGSRREIEQWISDGRVRVNDQKATLGDRITLNDKVLVDGKPIHLDKIESGYTRIIILNKPEGVVCTRKDPEGRPTVFDKLPATDGERWISVGRLDINTAGLLILTTDGELANRLMHPSYEVDREYAVRVAGEVDETVLQTLKEGVLLEDGMARFSDIQEAGGTGYNHWYHVVLMEGKNREVRRLWESQGVQVSRLKRVRFGCVFLPSRLKVGFWEEMTSFDARDLYELVGLKPKRVKKKTPKEIKEKERRMAKRGSAYSEKKISGYKTAGHKMKKRHE